MYRTDRLVMTPGPTDIPHRVRMAMARETTNPDLDPSFLELYNSVRAKLARLLGTEPGSVYVLLGEAMLGLEASIANIVSPGDKVVVAANGVFGEGFKDLVEMYGGVPVVVESDWRRSFDLSELDRALEKNKDARAVTLVHCDTPSAILNDLYGAAKTVESYGAVLIVDAVSSIGGVEVKVGGRGVDFLIGGSQKVLNLPSGLTIVALSRKAWDAIEERGYKGFYLNLRLWREMLDGEGVFPYTMSDPLIYALNESLDMIFEEGEEVAYSRHRAARRASWSAVEALGLEPYPLTIEDSSPTVTAINVPRGVDEARLREAMWRKHGVMIAGSWGRLEGKVIRVGHMGIQASKTRLVATYASLAEALREQGYPASVGKVVEAVDANYKP